jgi:hypothetical protein
MKPDEFESAVKDYSEARKDPHPVKLVMDEFGNTVDADGRHRVIQAIKDGKKYMPVETTMRDGSTKTLIVDPNRVAARFGVTAESLKATDENARQFYKGATKEHKMQ